VNALPRVVLGGAAMALSACSGSATLSARDVYTIIDELDVAVRAEALAEPGVQFASGSAMNAASPTEAAASLERALVQYPCVDVVRTGASLSVAFSATLYNTYCGTGAGGGQIPVSGEETITFLQADGLNTSVDHAWKAVSNGYLTIDGTAHVTTAVTPYGSSQHVVNTLSWVRTSDGKSGHGQDDRTSPVTSLTDQAILPTGLRTWESDAGAWEMRPIDARLQDATTQLPFVGSFAVVTPERRALTFSVLYDSNGARLVLTDGTRSYSFNSPSGAPTE